MNNKSIQRRTTRGRRPKKVYFQDKIVDVIYQVKKRVDEDTVCMFLGLGLVIMACGLVADIVRRNAGSISLPGVTITRGQEKTESTPTPTLSLPKERTYQVKAGDGLWQIAESFYGDGNKWTKIWEANKKILPNPEGLNTGMVLVIPE